MNNNLIRTVAYIHIENKKLLLVRAKSKDGFYMPGGKRDADESDKDAIVREVKEELGIDLKPESIRHYGVFKAQAFGKLEGVMVEITCYLGKHAGKPTPLQEIDEARFFSYNEYLAMPKVAPAVVLIVKDLKKKKQIT